MKKVISLSLALASSVAMAADFKTNIESRVDMQMKSVETTAQAGTTTTDKSNAFVLNMLRVNMFGNVNDALSYRVRFRLTSALSATARDSSSNLVDMAYLDHKIAYFTLRVGKQNWGEAYGRESMISSSDVITPSDAYMRYNGNIIGTTAPTAPANDSYRFGVSALYKFAETHNLTLAISNPNKAETSTTSPKNNNSVGYGVYYNSVMFDKMFQPVLGYTVLPQDGDASAAAAARTKDGNVTLLALGFRSEVSAFTLDADYKVYNLENRNAGTNTANVKETSKSIYTSLMYNMGSLIPFVQYVNDNYTKENSAANDFKTSSIGAGIAYRPFADLNFRYHVVYQSISQKWSDATATNSKKSTSNIIFGFKADI